MQHCNLKLVGNLTGYKTKPKNGLDTVVQNIDQVIWNLKPIRTVRFLNVSLKIEFKSLNNAIIMVHGCALMVYVYFCKGESVGQCGSLD